VSVPSIDPTLMGSYSFAYHILHKDKKAKEKRERNKCKM
jgi:hypothetical protein